MSISTGPGKSIIIFEVVIAEVEKVIFPWSLIGATILFTKSKINKK